MSLTLNFSFQILVVLTILGMHLLEPTNVTSDDARRRQFGGAVFHEPRINPQAHGILL